MTSTAYLRKSPLVVLEHTAAGLPAADDGWTMYANITPRSASEGVLARGGTATVSEEIGLQIHPGESIWRNAAASTLAQGKLVRLLVEVFDGDDATGAVQRKWLDGITRSMKPFWWGMVRSPSRVIGPASAATWTWTCDQLWSYLDRVLLVNCPALSGAGAVRTLHRFPAIDPDKPGTRSADRYTINGRNVYVVDDRRGSIAEAGGATATGWQARDLVELLLAIAKAPTYLGVTEAPGGMDWQLGDGAALLEWPVPRLDLHGDSALSALRSLIDHRRGLTARFRVVGQTVYLDVLSTAAESVDTGDGWVVPAAPLTTFSAITDIFIGDVQLVADATSADIIVVTGGHQQVGITLWWTDGDTNSALLPDGWDLSDDPDPDVDSPAWRRWRINPAWNGLTWNSPTDPVRGLSHPTGANGERQVSVDFASLRGVTIDRELPWGPNFTAEKGDPERPLALIYEGGQATLLDTTITVLDEPAGLELARDATEAARLQGMLTGGATLLVTVGMREPAPLQVVWQRPRAQWPSPVPRVVTHQRPDLIRRVGLATAVIGIDEATGGTKRTETESIRDDGLADLRRMLALLRVRHAVPGASASYALEGNVDTHALTAPGTFIAGIQTSATVTEAVNAPITERSWDFDQVVTRVTTERPDTPIGKLL